MISGCMAATAVQERPLKGTKKIGHSDTGRCIPSHTGTAGTVRRYPICRVKVTRRSVLHVRRSEPPWSCMMRRERLSPMPEPSGLVV